MLGIGTAIPARQTTQTDAIELASACTETTVPDHRWSVKRFLRDVALSATYGQTAAGTPVAASRCLPTFPFFMRCDGGPERVIRCEDSWLVSRWQAMPVLPRWRHEIGEPVHKLKRRELDDAIGPRPRGRSAGFHRVSCGDKISSCRSCTLKTCSHMGKLAATG
jgi:hypothetical protein